MKKVLQIALIIIKEKSECIYIYSKFYRKYILTFHNVIVLITPVVDKNKNYYYSNLFLEKVLCKQESDTRYFRMNVCIF